MTCYGHARRARRHRRRSRRHGMGPWGSRGRFFGPGEVRLALLSLLAEGGPQHGYELMKGLEARSGGMYRSSAGTVYPTLQQLEDEGLATSEAREGKRVYQITDAGRSELEGEAETVGDIWERAEEWGDWGGVWEPGAAEIMRPALRLLKAAVRALARDDDPGRVEEIRAILERARRDVEALRRED